MRSTKKIISLALLVAVACCGCCKKKKMLAPLDTGAFITGFVWEAGKRHAVRWHNGIVHKVGDSSIQSIATCITHVGDNLYIGGSTIDAQGLEHAAYWRNDTLVTVPENYGGSSIADIEVVNGVVYLFGTDGDGSASGKYLCYWKNGTQTLLTTPTNCYAGRMCIANGKVYTCGSEVSGGVSYAGIWQDNQLLQYYSYAAARDITYANGQYYVVGTKFNGNNSEAVLWQEFIPGAFTLASTYAQAYGHSITLDGNYTYVGGTDRGPTDTYSIIWNSGSAKTIATSQYYGDINAMDLMDNSVHACGTVSNGGAAAAAYWQNGNLSLLDPTKRFSSCVANDIDYIKK
jgi:hypothetical protein